MALRARMDSLSALATRHVNPRRLGAAQILTGAALGQVVALVAAPVLSRIYSPSDFGVFTVVSAVTLTMATVLALRLDFAVPLPENPRDAYSIATLAFLAIAALTVLTSCILFVFGRSISVALRQPWLMPWLLMAPVLAAATSAFKVLNQFAIRQGRFSDIGRRNFMQSAIAVVSQVAIGWAGGRPGGLILGLGLGQAAGATSLLHGTGLRSLDAREGRKKAQLAATLRRYWRFPVILAPSGLLNTLGLQIPVVLMAYWYGPQVAGWLGLTQRVLFLPVMLLGTTVAQVFLAEIAKAAHGSPHYAAALFATTSRRLAIVGLTAAVPVLLLGPWAFSFFLGSQWRISGEYAQALSISMAASLIADPVSQTLIVFEEQMTQAAWDGARLIATVGSVAVCAITRQSALTAVWAYSVVSAAAFAVSWWLSKEAIEHALREDESDLRAD